MIYLGSQKRLTSFWLGRTCVFCLSRKVNKTRQGYLKCRRCKRSKSLKRLRRELGVVLGFVDQRPALQIAQELHLSYNTVTAVYKNIRECLYYQCELEGKRLSGTWRLMKHTSAGDGRARKGEELPGKASCWASWKGAAKSTRGSSPLSRPRPSWRSSGLKPGKAQSFSPTPLKATTPSSSLANTTKSITPKPWHTGDTTTSTASRASGLMPNTSSTIIMVSPEAILRYT